MINSYIKMKHILALIVFALPFIGIGQTTTENYVKTSAYKVATSTGNVDVSQKTEQITYYDGLGRPKQSVAARAGGNRENIVTYSEYDSLGRAAKTYLPYATPGEVTGDYLQLTDQAALKAAIGTFYNTDKYEYTLNPYSETLFEKDATSRPLRQGAPGNSWAVLPDSLNDHTIHFNYRSNTVSDGDTSGDDVLKFRVSFTGGATTQPTLTLNGIYPENTLFITNTQDENYTQTEDDYLPEEDPIFYPEGEDPAEPHLLVLGGNHATQEFTNKSGQVILKRTFENDLPHDTYYVYDDFGNLTYVLSPEASTQIVSNEALVANAQDILDNLGYQYKYDYRNRLTDKKIPGKGWEYILYDKLDRPVLTQDARLHQNNQWLFTKYDALNRAIYTGIYTTAASRTVIQQTLSSATTFNESVTSSSISIDGEAVYYTNNAFPTTALTLHTINYYDTYVGSSSTLLPAEVYGQPVTTATHSLPTVSKVRVLDTDDWITTLTGYDEKARPIYSMSENEYLDTQDTSETLLDFTGKPLQSRTVHSKGTHQTVTTTDFFTYDHQDRLATHLQQINEEPVQLIASNTYDELGQLVSKKVGGQLFESGYTDISSYITITDHTIEKTSGGSSSYNAGLSTIGRLEGDGGLSFTAETENKRFIVGFNDQSNTNSHSEIDYGISFFWQNPPRYISQIRENGNLISLHSATPYSEGDTFAIEREGNEIHFIHNGSEVASYTMTQNYPSLIGDLSIRDEGTQIGNLNLYATTIDKSLQNVDYKYNIRGWLTDINDVDAPGREDNLFNFHINYDGPIEGSAGNSGYATPLYNGNISQTVWSTLNTDDQKHTYGYKYDALNRIKVAYSRQGQDLLGYDHYNVHSINYDQNGNLLSLTRQGEDVNGNAQAMDELSYTYNGNQLQQVTDGATSSIAGEGFYDGYTVGDDYKYDVNGNMIEDKNKGITSITYNHLNLPERVTIDGTDGEGNPQLGYIFYTYDATGVKLEKRVEDLIKNTTGYTYYANGYLYKVENNVEGLIMFPHPEGYIEPVYNSSKSVKGFSTSTQTATNSGYQYAFQYKDHLGNIRLTYADSDLDGAIKASTEIISEKHYYPFGLKHKGYNNEISGNVNSTADKYKYNGQELEEELGKNTYAYQWRDYDPAIARFNKIDRFAEKYYNTSPYAFTKNNPIRFREIAGDSLWISFGSDNQNRALYQDGQLLNADGSRYEGKGVKVKKDGSVKITNSFLKKAVGALNEISSGESEIGTDVVSTLQGSENNFTIQRGGNRFSANQPGERTNININDAEANVGQILGKGPVGDGPPSNTIGTGGIIFWDPDSSPSYISQGGRSRTANSSILLGHELFHAYDSDSGNLDPRILPGGTVRMEARAVYFGNQLRNTSTFGNRPLRYQYSSGATSLLSNGSPLYIAPPSIELNKN